MEDDLQLEMERLYQKQKKWLMIQGIFAYLSIVFFWLAIVLLFVEAAIMIIPGTPLTHKATYLAQKKYPYVPLAQSVHGKGGSWDIYIIAEARRLNDDLTVKILKYDDWSIYCFGAAMLGNIATWIQASKVVELIIRFSPS